MAHQCVYVILAGQRCEFILLCVVQICPVSKFVGAFVITVMPRINVRTLKKDLRYRKRRRQRLDCKNVAVEMQENMLLGVQNDLVYITQNNLASILTQRYLSSAYLHFAGTTLAGSWP